MSQFQPGDRVQAGEQQRDADNEEMVPKIVVGTVVSSVPAISLYKKRPTYKKMYRGDRKSTKFPAGTLVYRIAIDGERVGRDGTIPPRNFHESQLTKVT